MNFKLMSTIITVKQSKPEKSENVLQQLLDCVKECQKRFGGKKELATECDSCVAGLCLSFEAVLLHGTKDFEQIENNTLSFGKESPVFWPTIKEHLSKHELERFNSLKNIWTDTGRGRAWIRSCLNENSLERYFYIILSNIEILNKHYEHWALLCDQESNNLLSTMAAGIGSILFAISIDKSEFNTGIPIRIKSDPTKIEPIIDVPVKDNSIKKLKKHKVVRQIISFDEDSMLSTSFPSSSSSVSSDLSLNEQQSSSTISQETNQSDICCNDLKINERKLSNEKKEKYLSDISGTLTPIIQNDVGELTPVSVEINTNFVSPTDNDDLLLEVPTDISAVLTAVELKNSSEIRKKDEQIDNLLKENDNLKKQIKLYIKAIQIVKNNNNEDFDKIIDNLQVNNSDLDDYYIDEAKLFESKLVQIAEMHAELLDFNVMLQQKMQQKDHLLERLRTELEELRGPMSTDNLPLEQSTVNIWIPSAFLTGNGSNSHHVYQIFIRTGNEEWNIYRRYAQFYALHSDLKKLDPIVNTFDFPSKKSFNRKDSALVEDRRKRLQIYLRKILIHWPELTQCTSRFMLEQHLAFFKDQKITEQKSKGIFSNRRNDNHYTGL